MVLASVVFAYYSIWVMVLVSALQFNNRHLRKTPCDGMCLVFVQPFVAADHALHHFFLPRYYALAVPIAAGAVLLCAIGELNE